MKIKLNRFLAGALTVCFMIPQTGFAVKAETENPPSAEDTVLETIPETTEETETSEDNFEIMPIRETEESGEEKILANAALSDREAVEADLAEITEESILSVPLADGYLVDPLELDTITEGKNGSTVTWTTSDEEIISKKGELTRPAADTIVTVTATASLGEDKAEKSFEFNVAGQSTDIDGMPGNIYPVYFDGFYRSDKIDSRIKTSRFVEGDTAQIENGKQSFNRIMKN